METSRKKAEALCEKYGFHLFDDRNTAADALHEILTFDMMDDEDKETYLMLLDLRDQIREHYNTPNPHGRVVRTRFDPYHDVKIYEDGHEESFYIGE